MDPHQQQLGSQQEEAIPETQLGQPSSGEPSGSQQQGGDEGAAAPALSILSDLFAEVSNTFNSDLAEKAKAIDEEITAMSYEAMAASVRAAGEKAATDEELLRLGRLVTAFQDNVGQVLASLCG